MADSLEGPSKAGGMCSWLASCRQLWCNNIFAYTDVIYGETRVRARGRARQPIRGLGRAFRNWSGKAPERLSWRDGRGTFLHK